MPVDIRRPVFSEDGESWWLEKVGEAPDGTVRELWTQTPEEFVAFWKPIYLAKKANIIP
jgi:hypothetical protein